MHRLRLAYSAHNSLQPPRSALRSARPSNALPDNSLPLPTLDWNSKLAILRQRSPTLASVVEQLMDGFLEDTECLTL